MSSRLSPESGLEAVDIVREHLSRRQRLTIVGANTRTLFDVGDSNITFLSSISMAGIVDYDPGEMVMTAKAGTTLREIDEALIKNGQCLAFDPMDYRPILASSGEPTIGGAFAVNASGPARFVNGAARDHLLGVRFINGAAEAVRAGGRVMKNVTGLDLAKLMAGSRGTLGLITEVTFKVLPRPQSQSTIVVACGDDERAAKAMAAAMAQSVGITGAAYLPPSVVATFALASLPAIGAVVFRLEGLEESVGERTPKLSAFCRQFGDVTFLDGVNTAMLWAGIRDARPFSSNPERPLWRISLAPMSGYKFVRAIKTIAPADVFFDWQGGLVWLQMHADARHEDVRRQVGLAGGGHATLVRASKAERQSLPVFQPQPRAVEELSRRIQLKFDPEQIFQSTLTGGL